MIDGMGYLGLGIDAQANDAGETDIGTGTAKVLVIRTDEERIIARSVAAALG